MFQRIVTAALCIGVMGAAVSAKDYALGSPSGQLVANISAGDGISYYVSFGGENVIAPSALSMTLSDGQVVGMVKSERLFARVLMKQFHHRLPPLRGEG